MSRRTVLLAGTLAAVSACTSTERTRPDPVDPDQGLVDEAVTREQALLAAYDAALSDHPALAALLLPLREEHRQHLSRLRPDLPSPSPSRGATAVRDRPERRRAALAKLEATAAREHGAATLVASRALAPVLASLAASEASHGVLL